MDTDLPPFGAPNSLETTTPSSHPGNTTIAPSLPITPPDASDVRKLKHASQTSPVRRVPRMNQKHSHHNITMPEELKSIKKTISTELKPESPSATCSYSGKRQHTMRTHAPTAGGGPRKGLKRPSTATRGPGSQPHTIFIRRLPEGWSATNDRGTKVTKRQL